MPNWWCRLATGMTGELRRSFSADVQTALRQIEDKASNSAAQDAVAEPAALAPQADTKFHKKTRRGAGGN